MLTKEATRESIESFLSRKLNKQKLWAEDDIQFFSRDVRGNVYHVSSLKDADSIVFRFKS